MSFDGGTVSPVPFVSWAGGKAKRSTANAVGPANTANGHLIEAGRNFRTVGGAVRNLLKRREDRDGNSVALFVPRASSLLRYSYETKVCLDWIGFPLRCHVL